MFPLLISALSAYTWRGIRLQKQRVETATRWWWRSRRMKKEASRRQPSLPLNASIRGASKARIVASPAPQYPPPWRKKESTNLRLSRCTPLRILDTERIGCEDSRNPRGEFHSKVAPNEHEWRPWKEKLKIEPKKGEGKCINKESKKREREKLYIKIADRR